MDKDIIVRNTRSECRKTLFTEVYYHELEFITMSRLQTGKFIIGRMMYLCAKPQKGHTSLSKHDASVVVAKELRDDWIQKNVYPMLEKAVAKRIKYDYEKFLELRKSENHKDKPNTAELVNKAKQFNKLMSCRAYDIRCQNPTYQRELELEHGIKLTDEDISFYEDNCNGAYKATCSNTVPRNWLKQNKRIEERKARLELRRCEMLAATKIQEEIQQEDMERDFECIAMQDDECRDPDFSVEGMLDTVTESSHVTRTSKNTTETTHRTPPVCVRTGRKTLNESLMRCLVQCLSQYKVTCSDLMGITVQLANTVFHQQWRIAESENVVVDETAADSSSDSDDENEQQNDKKRKRKSEDMSFVMPSRRCLMNYLEDASYMNLEVVAKKLLEKDNAIVTVGLDDTTKAAGHRLLDVKTDHITISGPNESRQTFTTGFIENISHSGKDGADAYEFKLTCLAILAQSSLDEIKHQIDFWMTDRAADCKTLLENLGVDDDQILKCCAHIILGVDHAIDKVFRDAEQKIGLQNLIDCGKILKSPSSSVHTVGLIAVTKLLSPSHASHSVSLYGEYMQWMAMKGYDTSGFKGFTSNRFGRIAELAKEYLKRRDSIVQFFDEMVDINANKLCLAVYTFITNEWFLCCTEVYSLLGEMVIFPTMDLLGIDVNSQRDDRNWFGVRTFFQIKLAKLLELREKFGKTMTGKGRLIGFVLEEVVDTINRQLAEMSFFDSEFDTVNVEKLQFAPLTNLGCESQFAKLDNKVKASGGLTSVSTYSKKNIVSNNGFLVQSDFVDISEESRRTKWKWARKSDEVTKVKQLERDFLENVKLMKTLALNKKEEMKKKKIMRTIKLLENCQKHGGPITTQNMEMLKKMTQAQLLSEIAYMRSTIAPDIHQKRRVKQDNGKFKFETFKSTELIQSITNIIKPQNCVNHDIDSLLKVALGTK